MPSDSQRLIVLFLSGSLMACNTTPVARQSPPPEPAPVQVPAVDPVQQAQKSFEDKLLDQAELAFRKGRLTAPSHDNAYDRFHSVLLINPDNQLARSGLQAILIRFADMIREALGASNYAGAEALLKQAQIYYPGNTLLLDLQEEARKARKHYQQVSLTKPDTTDMQVEEFELSPQTLRKDKEQLVPLITSIAQRVQQTDESVMIYATTDAEGRWIYSQMKKAVPGYRVRGDIRIASRPRIAILPPL